MSVNRWDSAMDEGVRLRPAWILIRGFPMKLRYFHEFAHLSEPYGQVLALDPETTDHIDFRVARVRVGLCDDWLLPPLSWILYCDQSGYWNRYDIEMEVEQSIPPPPPFQNKGGGQRPTGSGASGNGGSSTNDNKEKDKWQEIGGSSSGSGALPPKNSCANGKKVQ